MSDEEESLAWHALNYRTAHTLNAEEMWQELQKFVARKRYEEREFDIQEENRRANAAWALMCRKMDQTMRRRAVSRLSLSSKHAAVGLKSPSSLI